VLSPQSAERAQKQATADKLKFNLLVDANNEVRKAFGVVYTFTEDLKNEVFAGTSQLPSTNCRGKRLDRPMSHGRSGFCLGAPVNDCDFRDGSETSVLPYRAKSDDPRKASEKTDIQT